MTALGIHSVYQGRVRRLARRWPRLTLAVVAGCGCVWLAVAAVNAAVTGGP